MKADITEFTAWSSANGIETPLTLSLRKQIVSSPLQFNPQPGFCANTPIGVTLEKRYRCMTLPPSGGLSLPFNKDDETGLDGILKVPMELCISDADALSLAEKLMFEVQNEKSKFHPWLSTFPSLNDFEDMPQFWSQDRRDFLRKFDQGQLEDFMVDECIVYEAFGESSEKQWALACVNSRANYLPDGSFALTPMLDMFNHKSSVQTKARTDDDSNFCLSIASASRAQSPAEDTSSNAWNRWLPKLFGVESIFEDESNKNPGEVFISYGELSNTNTLCRYGFIDDDENEHNLEIFRVRVFGQEKPIPLIVDSTGEIETARNQINWNLLKNVMSVYDSVLSGDDRTRKCDLELYALILGELDAAIDDASMGLDELSSQQGRDTLIIAYLQQRRSLLAKARDLVLQKFPGLSD